MKKPTIAIDCDDVIVPTAPLILEHYNKTYGANLTLKDLYSKDLSLWNAPDITTAIKRVEKYLITDEYQNVEPFLDAIEVMVQLSEHYDLHVVTGRSEIIATATKDMLTRHFPDMFRSIEFTNFFSAKPRHKANVCQDLGATMLIDDHLHHARTVAECGIDVLLFGNYPWNEAHALPSNIRRVRDWHEIAELLLPGTIKE